MKPREKIHPVFSKGILSANVRALLLKGPVWGQFFPHEVRAAITGESRDSPDLEKLFPSVLPAPACAKPTLKLQAGREGRNRAPFLAECVSTPSPCCLLYSVLHLFLCFAGAKLRFQEATHYIFHILKCSDSLQLSQPLLCPCPVC